MASEMPVFTRFLVSCLGIAPPVVRLLLPQPGNAARTGPRAAPPCAILRACSVAARPPTERGRINPKSPDIPPSIVKPA